jgi:sterol desaturase/sphingolipid hydroxylase (fatty acid hydroxylase superfamily)
MKQERHLMIPQPKPHQQRVRLFQNEPLERLTMLSPAAFAMIWSVNLAMVGWASWGGFRLPAWSGLVLVGLLGWTLFEYGMHRFIFHLRLRSAAGQRLIFLLHGNHHRAPSDGDRNLMPPIFSMPVLGACWGLFLLLLGSAGSVVFLGFAIGYVAYDLTHYACHQFTMAGAVLGRLQRHHARHHYARRDGNYAITAIFWDRLFGTRIPFKKG